jgi:hypothetical protein
LADEPAATIRRLLDRFHYFEWLTANLVFERDTWRAINRVASAFVARGYLDADAINYAYCGGRAA